MTAKRKTRDARLSNDSGVRKDRGMVDRSVTQNRVLTDDERLREFRQMSFQSALPDIPPIEGFHVCWLTTENPRDPIHGRIRLGYEPVTPTDIPGWEHAALKSGEWEGCIGVNEMVAFKLPLDLYEAYMRENHHTQPLYEEGKLDDARRNAEAQASTLANENVSFELEEGMSDLQAPVPEPASFEETLRGNRGRPFN